MEKPILFSAPMVRAILEGRKTQTRRVVQPVGNDEGFVILNYGNGDWPYRSDDGDSTTHTIKRGGKLYQDETPHACPYGHSGDQLWVRETWRTDESLNDKAPSAFTGWPVQYEADGTVLQHGAFFGNTKGKTRVSIHMPRWASRILLNVTGLRVERLHNISEEDAIAEGTQTPCGGWVGGYQNLWNSINGADSWDANPWVWVISFEVVKHG